MVDSAFEEVSCAHQSHLIVVTVWHRTAIDYARRTCSASTRRVDAATGSGHHGWRCWTCLAVIYEPEHDEGRAGLGIGAGDYFTG